MDEVRKKSLREVLPKKDLELAGKKANPGRRQKIDISEEPNTPKSFSSFNLSGRRLFSKMSYLAWACIAVIAIVGGYYLSTLFATVTVKITPRQETVTIAGSFEASRAPADGIEFSVIKLEETATKQVPASGQVKVETKATGVVTITNNYSTAAQKLVAGTRLETKTGLIFKLDNTITVPGQSKKGSVITSGSISVKVTASAIGSQYNVGMTSFKIVGFKGTPRYDKFAVQTKTAIAGGKQGLENVVKEADRIATANSLQLELKDQVSKKAKLQIPKDFIIFDDGVIISYTDQIQNGTTDGVAIVSVKATMIALLFDLKNLSQYFVEKQLKNETIGGIKISNPQSLVFKLQNKDKFDFEKTNKILFTLDGKANLVWPIDTTSLKSKLLSTAIRNKDKVFADYSAIYRAEAVVRPPWILFFPDNQDKINIKLITQ
jgi:hypothetical protein